MFFLIKEGPSGRPPPDMTEREKEEYSDTFERENGVSLPMKCIGDNPPRHKIAKLILNSLWGGFLKNPLKKKVKDIVANRDEFVTWIDKDCFVEKIFQILSKQVLLMTHRVQKKFVKHNGKGDMVHGIFTTALACLKLLLEGLLKKCECILYMDVDSIIFMEYPNDTRAEDIVMANVLGRWVDQITPEKHFETGLLRGRYISGFVSGGPKNYGLEICWCNEERTIPKYEDCVKESKKCVIRGFKKDGGDVTFNAMKKIAFDLRRYAHMNERQRIEWAKKEGIIHTYIHT